MRSLQILTVCLSVCLSAVAQTGVSFPRCDGRNDVSNAAFGFPIMGGQRLAILYTPDVPIRLEGVELYFTAFGDPNGVLGPLTILAGGIEVRPADPATLQPTSNLLTTGIPTPSLVPVPAGTNWVPFSFQQAVELDAGVGYWFIYDPGNGGVVVGVTGTMVNGIEVAFEPGGTDLTLSLFDDGSGNGFGVPRSSEAFKIRVGASNCNPAGTGPAWLPVGSGCSVPGNAPRLVTVGVPALGSTPVLGIRNGQGGAPYGLFLSAGVSSLPQAIGGGCDLWLEPTSFAALTIAGVNPVFVSTLDVTGSADLPLPVPAAITSVGGELAFQVGVAAPTSPIGAVLTEAVVARIGF